MFTLDDKTLDARIERWRKNLIDTSLRNSLLNLREGRQGCLKLMRPHPQAIYDRLVKNKSDFELYFGADDGTEQYENKVLPDLGRDRAERSLLSMRTKARAAVREQGTNILFLTVGALEWSHAVTDGERIRSPLVLIPVELVREGPLRPYRLVHTGDDISVNPTLAQKLKLELRLTLPQLLEGDLDIQKYLDAVADSVAPLKDWKITSEVRLGLFNFPKMCMYDELATYRSVAAAHPVIRSMAGDTGASHATLLEEPTSPLDRDLPAGSFQILDADSSQQEAVALAAEGASFVLQGPPGTGKSQTITNIISESLAKGRTVLFVSEKMAALEVVKRRLDENGLGDYCLELHSHKASRQTVANELSKSLTPVPVQPQQVQALHELEGSRARLDSYVDALHRTRDGLGMPVFQLLEELVRLKDAPELVISLPNIEKLSWKELEAMAPLVRDLQRYAPVLAQRSDHPWTDCLVDSWKLGAQSEMVHRLSDLKFARTRLNETSSRFAQDHGLPEPAALGDVEQMVGQFRHILLTTYPLPRWIEKDPVPLLRAMDNMKESYSQLNERMTWLRARFNEDVLALDLASMQERFTEKYSSFTRSFNSRYRHDLDLLRSMWRGDRKLTYDEVMAELPEVINIAHLADRVRSMEAECTYAFGKYFQGQRTDWEALHRSVEWARQYYEKFGEPASDEVRSLLCDGPEKLIGLKGRIDELETSCLRFQEALSALSQYFTLDKLAGGRPLHEVPFEELGQWAQYHLDTASSFREWAESNRVRRQLEQAGLGDLVILAERSALPGDLWNGIRKRHLTLWYDLLVSRDRLLRDFNREEQESEVARFERLDGEMLRTAASRTRAVLDERRRELCEDASPAHGSGLWVLKHEVNRKKNIRPLRELFQQAWEPILALRPCLLMSPLSVSMFLDPSKIKFDLVIFDEASQIRPEDAIGSIMRGKQVIVVGDAKQLPPTDFFREVSYDDEDDIPDLESVLDECSSSMPQRMLRWHYRSRHESLIAFSNHYFYNDRLSTFPSSVSHEGLGVSFVHVPEGEYDRGRSRRNPVEAAKVVELVFQHFRSEAPGSIGVVAFSEAQQMAILEEVEKRLKIEPDMAPFFNEGKEEEFFVKNLENVQGDERDVMIFSVGYGKDAQGRMHQGFGPLNRPGGERRLNVAITRARRQVVLVSSLLPEDIEGTAPGAEMLRNYIEYAMKGGDKGSLPNREDAFSYPIEEDIRNALVAKGLKVDRRVGCSEFRIDLAVQDGDREGNYLLGIMCDGASYRSGKTTRDRERLRREVLEGLGWNVMRMWSQDWIHDPEKEVERVMEALKKARENAAWEEGKRALIKASRSLEATAPAVPLPAAPEAPAALPAAAPAKEVMVAALSDGPAARSAADACPLYQAVDFREREDLLEKYADDPAEGLRDALLLVVNEEGPVHASVAKARIKDYIRLAGGKMAALDRRFDEAVKSLDGYSVTMDGEFLWPCGMTAPAVRRFPDRHSLDLVCPRELEEAVLYCLREGACPEKEVVMRTSALYGYKRPTPAMKERILSAACDLVNRGMAYKDTEGLRRAEEEKAAPEEDAGEAPLAGTP